MAIEILWRDLSPIDSGTPVPGLEAGLDSDVLELALRNPGPADAEDLLVVIQTELPGRPGTYVSSGLAPQDQLWARARLAGQDNSGAPTQQDIRTEWTPIGAFAALHVPNIRAGGVRYLDLKLRPPGTAAPAPSWLWALGVVELEHARAVPPALASVNRGVLTRLGEADASAILRGSQVTASSPPDDRVHVAAGQHLHHGRLLSRVAEEVELDQNDAAAVALAAGQAYWAAISLGPAGAVATKGAAAVDPLRPAAPAGHALAAYVRVAYGATGSEIAPEDVDDTVLVYDRFELTVGAGLQVFLHGGQALGGGTWRFQTGKRPLAVEPSSTNYVWQLASGLPEITTAPEPPEGAGVLALWEVDTDADEVTAVRDRRTFAGLSAVLHLKGELPGAPGEISSLLVQEDVVLERGVFRISDAGGGASGATVLDVLRNGTTLFTSQATDDQRPTWAFDATDLISDAGLHEVTELRRGDVISLVSAEHPTGGAPLWAEAYFECRRI